MKVEEAILACIKDTPGSSAKKIVSCLDSQTNLVTFENKQMHAMVYKKLRLLRKNGEVHSKGDSWYFLNRKI